MSNAGEVEGGLDEPEALQPEPGSLALASAADDWSRADWESAAAKALRKTRRLGDDAPDDAVWAALTRTTYEMWLITRPTRGCGARRRGTAAMMSR